MGIFRKTAEVAVAPVLVAATVADMAAGAVIKATAAPAAAIVLTPGAQRAWGFTQAPKRIGDDTKSPVKLTK